MSQVTAGKDLAGLRWTTRCLRQSYHVTDIIDVYTSHRQMLSRADNIYDEQISLCNNYRRPRWRLMTSSRRTTIGRKSSGCYRCRIRRRRWRLPSMQWRHRVAIIAAGVRGRVISRCWLDAADTLVDSLSTTPPPNEGPHKLDPWPSFSGDIRTVLSFAIIYLPLSGQ